MSRRRPISGEDKALLAGAIKARCESCGYTLGYLTAEPDGSVRNVDIRPQPSPARLLLTEHGRWDAHCKCGASPQVREENLHRAVLLVRAAGLDQMPFKAPTA